MLTRLLAGGWERRAVLEGMGLTTGPRDDWFDPDVKVDTNLFLDPFLLLRGGGKVGEGA